MEQDPEKNRAGQADGRGVGPTNTGRLIKYMVYNPPLTISIPDFTHQKVEVIPPGLFRGTQLLINGQPALHGVRRGEYRLTDDHGQTVTVKFRNQAFGLDYPQLMVGRQFINIVQPLKWYWWAWAVIPFFLVTFGGALGGLIAVWFNVRLLRRPWYWLARMGATLGVTLLAVASWLLLYLCFFRAP